MYIAIVLEPGCDVINFEINLIFLIKLFFFMTKRSRQKLKYLENEIKGFQLPKIVSGIRLFLHKNTDKILKN